MKYEDNNANVDDKNQIFDKELYTEYSCKNTIDIFKKKKLHEDDIRRFEDD